MDMIDTNAYHSLSENQSNTYGVQRTINQYNEKQGKLREARLRQAEEGVYNQEVIADEELDMNDPLYTNRIDDALAGSLTGTALRANQISAHLNSDPVLRPGRDLRSSVAMEPVGITRDVPGPIGLRPVIDPITGAKSAGRQIYEKIRLINISSKDRVKWVCEELPVDPVTNQYTRLIQDEEGHQIVCKYTSDLLNAEYYWNAMECLNNVRITCLNAGCNPICQLQTENLNSIAEPFFTKDCRIFMKIPKFPNPNNYTIFFNSPFSYIKEISLVAAEIPNPFRTIGPHNNKIIFHVKDSNGRALPFKQDYRGIPFFLIEIVPGIYTLERLLSEMENLANDALEQYGDPGKAELRFQISYDCITEIVSIKLIDKAKNKNRTTWLFHWRFWNHCTIPVERTLYRMLGFGRAFLRDRDGCDYYSSCLDSAWLSSPSCISSSNSNNSSLEAVDTYGCRKTQKYPRPFARPNLFPDTFFYLIIDNLDLGNDAIYACNPDLTINNIFAKIQVIPLCCDQLNNPGVSAVSRGLGSADNGTCNKYQVGTRNDYLYNTQVSSNKIYLESPLRTLDRMDIRFVDAFGDPVDFGRLDHSLTFRIVQYIDYLVDTNFDSTRGI